jgi:hypothetical protein
VIQEWRFTLAPCLIQTPPCWTCYLVPLTSRLGNTWTVSVDVFKLKTRVGPLTSIILETLMRQPCSQEHIKFTSFGKKRFKLLGCLCHFTQPPGLVTHRQIASLRIRGSRIHLCFHPSQIEHLGLGGGSAHGARGFFLFSAGGGSQGCLAWSHNNPCQRNSRVLT